MSSEEGGADVTRAARFVQRTQRVIFLAKDCVGTTRSRNGFFRPPNGCGNGLEFGL